MDEKLNAGDVIAVFLLLPGLAAIVISAHVIGMITFSRINVRRAKDSSHWVHDYSSMLAEGCSLRAAGLLLAFGFALIASWLVLAFTTGI